MGALAGKRLATVREIEGFISRQFRELIPVELASSEIEEKLEAEASLRAFVEQAWPVLEPRRAFVPGWHLDAICEHLEAVSRGDIRNLLINIPPGCTKSLSVAVFWFAWVWGPAGDPGTRWLYASYASQLSIRDSLKCRRLVESAWYQRRWGHVFRLTSDQNQKMAFENNATGYRIATSVGAAGTGHRPDIEVIDDPHNVRERESEPKRKGVLTWHDEVWYNRVSEDGSRVIVMQRVHGDDLSARVLERDEWEHLCLPMEYETERPKDELGKPSHVNIPCETSIGFSDPRTKLGELLCPARFDAEELERLSATLGETAYAGQYQQRPAPKEGVLFKVDLLVYEDSPPCEVVAVGRGWDKAGTEGGGKYTAGVKIGRLQDGRWIVLDVIRGQWSAVNREPQIRAAASRDGRYCIVRVEQEPGSGGKDSAEDTVRGLSGYDAKGIPSSRDKGWKATPLARQVEAASVVVLRAAWTDAFVEELRTFPVGRFTDQGDAAAVIFNELAALDTQSIVWGSRRS